MRKFTPETNPLQNVKKSVPYAAELDETANLIAADTIEAIKGGKMSGIEAAGRFSLSALLSSVANGDVSIKDSFSFLKTLADKKTPDPIMRVEQHQTIDMRAMIVSAVEANPQRLEETVSLAFAARQQIQDRLGLTDGSLALRPATEPNEDSPAHASHEDPNADCTDTIESHPITHKPLTGEADWKPGDPPPELQNLKKELL